MAVISRVLLLSLLFTCSDGSAFLRFASSANELFNIREIMVSGMDNAPLAHSSLSDMAPYLNKAEFSADKCFDGNLSTICNSNGFSGNPPMPQLDVEYPAGTIVGRVLIYNRLDSNPGYWEPNRIVGGFMRLEEDSQQRWAAEFPVHRDVYAFHVFPKDKVVLSIWGTGLRLSDLQVLDAVGNVLPHERAVFGDDGVNPVANLFDANPATIAAPDPDLDHAPLHLQFPAGTQVDRIVLTATTAATGNVALETFYEERVWHEHDTRSFWQASFSGATTHTLNVVPRILLRVAAKAGEYLNLRDIEVFGMDGLPLAPSGFSFDPWSAAYGADKCFDGDLNNLCNSAQVSSDPPVPQLDAEFPQGSRVGRVVVWNCLDGGFGEHQRIVGGFMRLEDMSLRKWEASFPSVYPAFGFNAFPAGAIALTISGVGVRVAELKILDAAGNEIAHTGRPLFKDDGTNVFANIFDNNPATFAAPHASLDHEPMQLEFAAGTVVDRVVLTTTTAAAGSIELEVFSEEGLWKAGGAKAMWQTGFSGALNAAVFTVEPTTSSTSLTSSTTTSSTVTTSSTSSGSSSTSSSTLTSSSSTSLTTSATTTLTTTSSSSLTSSSSTSLTTSATTTLTTTLTTSVTMTITTSASTTTTTSMTPTKSVTSTTSATPTKSVTSTTSATPTKSVTSTTSMMSATSLTTAASFTASAPTTRTVLWSTTAAAMTSTSLEMTSTTLESSTSAITSSVRGVSDAMASTTTSSGWTTVFPSSSRGTTASVASTFLAASSDLGSSLPAATTAAAYSSPPGALTDSASTMSSTSTSSPWAWPLHPSKFTERLLLWEGTLLQSLGSKKQVQWAPAEGLTLAAYSLSKAAVPQTLSLGALKARLPAGALGQNAWATTVAVLEPDKLLASPDTMAFVSLTVYSKEGVPLSIKGLQEPIQVTVPLEEPEKVSACRFWHETRQEWLEEGVSILSRGPKSLTFATTHLTLFALVWQSFVQTVACAQHGLLSMHSVKALFASDWYIQKVALLFWAIMLLLSATCIRALRHDRCGSGEAWSDAHFLIPVGIKQASEEEEAPKKKLLSCASCANCARDAVDDLCSRWSDSLGGLRDLCESLMEALQLKSLPMGSRARAFFEHFVMALVAGNAQRQAGAALGLGDDIVSFLLQDEDLGELMANSVTSSELGLQSERSKRLRAWLYLHQSVLKQVDACWHEFDSWGKVPKAVWRLIIAAHPVSSVFMSSKLLPHSYKALLLACNLLGSLMLAALFFDGSGLAVKRGAQTGCDPLGVKNAWTLLGSLLAISLGSTLLAGLPVMLLSSLHTRSFRKLPSEGCAEWRQQLMTWRLQDRALWFLGCLYCAACIAFVCLFLANVDPRSLPNWGTSTLIQLLQEHFIIPLAIALAVPGSTALSLFLFSKHMGIGIRRVLKEQRIARCQSGNWQSLLASV